MGEPEQRVKMTFQKETIPQASIHNVELYLFKTTFMETIPFALPKSPVVIIIISISQLII